MTDEPGDRCRLNFEFQNNMSTIVSVLFLDIEGQTGSVNDRPTREAARFSGARTAYLAVSIPFGGCQRIRQVRVEFSAAAGASGAIQFSQFAEAKRGAQTSLVPNVTFTQQRASEARAAAERAEQQAERQSFVDRLKALNGRCLDFQQERIFRTHMPQMGAQNARNSHPSRDQCAYMVHESGIVAKANDLMRRASVAAGLREVGGGYVEFILYGQMEGLIFGDPALVDFRNVDVRLPQAPCIVGSSHRQENAVSFLLTHLVVCINGPRIEFYDYIAVGMSRATADLRRGCQPMPFMAQYCIDTFDVGVRIYTVRGL
jgi:hypothetical protein